MLIYLAGPSAELERVKSAARDLEEAGHTITQRWWERVEAMRAAGHTSDATVPDAYMSDSASLNREGIDEADYVVALCMRDGGLSSGTAYEIGYAGCRTTVLLVGNPRRHVASYDWGIIGRVPDMYAATRWIAGRA
jgi:nucleoside 2-deoxyribosyltransferase